MPTPHRNQQIRRLRAVLLRAVIGLGVLVAMLGVSAYGLLFVWPPTSVLETGATPAWPQMHPTAWRFSQTRAAAAVQESLDGWTNWEVCATPTCAAAPSGTQAPDASLVAGIVRGPITALDVWLVVRVEANGEGGALIFARTETQSGRSDFGQGARTLAKLWEDVAANLGGDVTFVGPR